jgi:enterochelin esterase-like enzyme
MALALPGCGGGGSGAPVQPVGRVVSASVTSAHTGYAYNIDIYLPASYDTGNASYPTVYVLDGDSRFIGPDTRFTNFKSILQRRGTNAILIGIGGTERRQTDYNFPGATAYHDFIALELIPYVESRFRSDPAKRMLSGLSTSGNFAATALFIEAPNQLVFSYFLSAEAAFWQQLSLVQDMEQQMFVALAGKSLPVTLILARSTGVGATNTVVVHDFYDRMAARHYVGMSLLETAFPYGHAEMDNPSFEDAIARLFG